MSIRRGDRGSASIEAAIAVPAFGLFVGLIIFGGRTAIAQQSVESAASDAARSASILRTNAEAKAAAKEAPVANLSHQGINCVRVDVDVATTQFSRNVGNTPQFEAPVSRIPAPQTPPQPGVP